jgi:CHASE2 domain-containing sensor protein
VSAKDHSAPNPHATVLERLKGLDRKFWKSFLAACVFVVVMEAFIEHVLLHGDAPGVTQSIFNFSGYYQRVVTAPRRPIPRHTVVVEIDPKKEQGVESLHNICAQRLMIARLLCRIGAAKADAIVLDKYYSERTCTENAALLEAVRNVSEETPIIVGRKIDVDGLYLDASMKLGEAPQVVEAAVNVDPDTRRLPLLWEAWGTEADKKRGAAMVRIKTIALAAAEASQADEGITSPLQHGEHPYISFLKADAIPRIPAGKILAAEFPNWQEGRFCPEERPVPELAALRGKIAIVGEINKDLDEHATPAGPMPGVYLQANFIEALLDGRHYRPVWVLDYVLGFLLLAAMYLILIAYHGEWMKAVGLILLTIAATGAVVYLLIVFLHWYVNPALIGAMGIVIRILHLAFGKAEMAAGVH